MKAEAPSRCIHNMSVSPCDRIAGLAEIAFGELVLTMMMWCGSSPVAGYQFCVSQIPYKLSETSQ